jgi:hypothetical protein
VTYGSASNAIPFPDDDEGRERPCFEQVRLHFQELDRELQRLARVALHRCGEWYRHTVAPLPRIQLLDDYLRSLFSDSSAVTVRQHRRRRRVEAARNPVAGCPERGRHRADGAERSGCGAVERLRMLDELLLQRIQPEFIPTALDEFA